MALGDLQRIAGIDRVADGLRGQGDGIAQSGHPGIATNDCAELLLVDGDRQHGVDIRTALQIDAVVAGNRCGALHGVQIPGDMTAQGAVVGHGDGAENAAVGVLIPQLQITLGRGADGLTGDVLTVEVDGQLGITAAHDLVDHHDVVFPAGISGCVYSADGDGLLVDGGVHGQFRGEAAVQFGSDQDGRAAVQGDLHGGIGFADAADGDSLAIERAGVRAGEHQLRSHGVHPEGVNGVGLVALIVGQVHLEGVITLGKIGKCQIEGAAVDAAVAGAAARIQIPGNISGLVGGDLDGDVICGVHIHQGKGIAAVQLLDLLGVHAFKGSGRRIGLHHGELVGIHLTAGDHVAVFCDAVGLNAKAVLGSGFQTHFPGIGGGH